MGDGEGGARDALTAREQGALLWAWICGGLERMMVDDSRKTAKTVTFTLWLVARYSTRGRSIYPSLDTLAAELSMSKNTIRQRLREAVDMGILRVAKAHTPTSTTEYEIGHPDAWGSETGGEGFRN